MVQKNKAPVNWMLRAAGVLLCLVLASTYLVCGMFARYTTSASGSDSARVAKFEIVGGEVVSEKITASLVPGANISCPLTIQNKSEVAVEYEVTVINETNNLPLSFRVYDESAEGYLEGDGTSFSANLSANGDEKNYNLLIEWSKERNAPEYAGMVDQIQVTVSATQID